MCIENKLIVDQLSKVEVADLSKFDNETCTYLIPRKLGIKLEEDKCYLIHLKLSAFTNQTVAVNWNGGSFPSTHYLKIDISKKIGNMIKVVSVGYDYENQKDLASFWSGWLCTDDFEVLSVL